MFYLSNSNFISPNFIYIKITMKYVNEDQCDDG